MGVGSTLHGQVSMMEVVFVPSLPNGENFFFM